MILDCSNHGVTVAEIADCHALSLLMKINSNGSGAGKHVVNMRIGMQFTVASHVGMHERLLYDCIIIVRCGC